MPKEDADGNNLSSLQNTAKCEKVLGEYNEEQEKDTGDHTSWLLSTMFFKNT